MTALRGTPETELIRLMNVHRLRHIPLVDESNRVLDLALLSTLAEDYELPLRAVVMAGGLGERLRPLTDEVPKPMLSVGDRPLLELMIEQLRTAGIRRVNIATHYKGDVISGHFGDGREFGVEIHYVKEDQPLGTAGALGLLESSDDPLLVINGDLVTKVNFRAMLDYHRDHQADMTVGVRQQEIQVPFGVVEVQDFLITCIAEKPVIRHFINTGIYLLDSSVCRYVSRGQSYDMPDLINKLIRDGGRVVSFPVHEYWLDVGQARDFGKAQSDIAAGKL